MPSITLNDVVRLRLQTISFFLLVLLLSAWAIQGLWNYLGRDFKFLPRLSYGKALGVVVLWGLLFILVLTMISGARELMTPGAWEKQGLTYRVAAPTQPEENLDRNRQVRMEELRRVLLEYSRSHEGRFPADRLDSAIGVEKWRVPGSSGMNYVYVGGLSAIGQPPTLLAFEPDVFGPQRLGLFTNGDIRWLGPGEIAQARGTEKP
jgi:hypothetical protein